MSASAFHVVHAREVAAAREQGRREGFDMAVSQGAADPESVGGGLIVLLTGVAIGVAGSGFLYWLFF